MNHTLYQSQIIGTIAVFLLFSIKLYIVANPVSWNKSGRISDLWTIIYVFFLFILRLVSLRGWADMDALRIVSAYSALLPLLGVSIHLFLFKSAPPVGDLTASMDEAKKLLTEAKQLKSDAVDALTHAQNGTDDTMTKRKK